MVPSWHCINTDAVVHLQSGFSTVGGAIPSSTGSWIIGYHKPFGFSSILLVELWGIFIALQLTLSLRIDCLQIQPDSKQAIQMINSSTVNCDHYPLVRAMARLRDGSCFTEFIWVLRESNSNVIVDALAKLHHDPIAQLLLLQDPLLPLCTFSSLLLLLFTTSNHLRLHGTSSNLLIPNMLVQWSSPTLGVNLLLYATCICFAVFAIIYFA
ncbi:hypothetical protein V6N11_029219 [Hibiscus sabdariffa]